MHEAKNKLRENLLFQNFVCKTGNGCWTVLDIVKGFILASFSTPNSPQVLVCCQMLYFHGEPMLLS